MHIFSITFQVVYTHNFEAEKIESPKDAYLLLRDTILKARHVKFWWDCGYLLPPKEILNDIIAGLEKLPEIVINAHRYG